LREDIVSNLTVERCNLVIVGAWNPAIVSPNWLKQEFPELFPGSEFQATFVPGPSPRIHFTMAGVQIDPNAGRLTLRPGTPDRQVLALIPRLALAVYERLPHTPVSAVGFNFIYTLDADETARIFEFLDDDLQEQFYREVDLNHLARSQVRHSFVFPTHRLNVIYDSKSDSETVGFNFNYRVGQSPQVISAIRAFAENLDISQRLSTQLIAKEQTWPKQP
jgi:hypothetical protein